MPHTPTWQRAADDFRELAEDLDDVGHGASIRGLMRRGLDIQNGNLVAETAYGAFPVAPGFCAPGGGDVPKGLEQEVARVRRTLTDSYAKAFSKWLPLALAGGDESAYAKLTHSEANALAEGTDSFGGALVPPDFAAQILARATALSVVRRGAKIIPTVSDVLRLPALTPNTSSASTFSSNFVASWSPEVPLFSETDPALETFEVAIKKLRVGTRLSSDLAADQGAAIGWLVEDGGANLAVKADESFIAGTGANHTPVGILNAGVTTVDVEGSTSNAVSNSTSVAGSMPKILGLIAALPSQYRAAARFILSAEVEADVRALVDGSGNFAFRRPTIDSFPADLSPHVPDGGTDGNKVMVFGNLSGYIVAPRSLTISVMRERFAETDQTGIILSERIGGGCYNVDAFRIGVV